MDLVTVRPDLVTQRGWAVGHGTLQRPVLPLMATTHPWFVADVIRWYAEHPEDRVAIGTDLEHERLVATLTAGYPAAATAAAARGPRPVMVTVAAWLTYVGVGWGLVYAGFLMFAAFAFQDRVRAVEQAIAAEEERITGVTSGPTMIGGADNMPLFAGIAIVVAVVAGIAGVLAARGVWRGSAAGRTGLFTVAGLVLFQSVFVFCIPSPATMALDAPHDAGWPGVLMLGGMVLNQVVTLGLSLAVIVLMLQATSASYFKPVGQV